VFYTVALAADCAWMLLGVPPWRRSDGVAPSPDSKGDIGHPEDAVVYDGLWRRLPARHPLAAAKANGARQISSIAIRQVVAIRRSCLGERTRFPQGARRSSLPRKVSVGATPSAQIAVLPCGCSTASSVSTANIRAGPEDGKLAIELVAQDMGIDQRKSLWSFELRTSQVTAVAGAGFEIESRSNKIGRDLSGPGHFCLPAPRYEGARSRLRRSPEPRACAWRRSQRKRDLQSRGPS